MSYFTNLTHDDSNDETYATSHVMSPVLRLAGYYIVIIPRAQGHYFLIISDDGADHTDIAIQSASDHGMATAPAPSLHFLRSLELEGQFQTGALSPQYSPTDIGASAAAPLPPLIGIQNSTHHWAEPVPFGQPVGPTQDIWVSPSAQEEDPPIDQLLASFPELVLNDSFRIPNQSSGASAPSSPPTLPIDAGLAPFGLSSVTAASALNYVPPLPPPPTTHNHQGPDSLVHEHSRPSTEIVELSYGTASAFVDLTCRWHGCGQVIAAATEAQVRDHLRDCHFGGSPGVLYAKETVLCGWDGCNKSLQCSSLVKHFVARHLQVKVKCSTCNRQLGRSDTLERHRQTVHRAEH